MTLSTPPALLARRRELVLSYLEEHPERTLSEALKYVRQTEEAEGVQPADAE